MISVGLGLALAGISFDQEQYDLQGHWASAVLVQSIDNTNCYLVNVTVTTPHRNALFRWTVVQHIHNMNILFTEPAYLFKLMHARVECMNIAIFYSEHAALFVHMFTTVLRHPQFIVNIV